METAERESGRGMENGLSFRSLLVVETCNKLIQIDFLQCDHRVAEIVV